jgi:hypothetical protein
MTSSQLQAKIMCEWDRFRKMGSNPIDPTSGSNSPSLPNITPQIQQQTNIMRKHNGTIAWKESLRARDKFHLTHHKPGPHQKNEDQAV